MVASDPFFTDQHGSDGQLGEPIFRAGDLSLARFTQAGGLISYGSSIVDAYHQAGLYAAKILKGSLPADLPVMQPTKFELVINLKTARALGLSIPATLLATADEVIE